MRSGTGTPWSRTLAVLGGLTAVVGLSLAAQNSPPATGGTGQGAASPGPTAGRGAPPVAGRGQGGGGRERSGPSLGGRMMDDPAYENVDFSPRDPVVPLTPEEQAQKFWLPPGYRMEAVLTDPVIQEPAQIAFDGNGRMFVLEIRGYMRDADGTGTLDPVGRISVHQDLDNDGVYEDHKVFVDGLVFPRFVVPYGADAVLTKESNADELWKFSDTDGDGVADRKELVGTGFGRVANVEHQESMAMFAMDNWLYMTYNAFRTRITPTGVVREPTGANRAAWGVTQDSFGKVWFQSGASGMPGYFQFPIVYGTFDDEAERFEPDLNVTWGAPVLVADMQPGMNEVRMPDGSLKHATGSAGNDVFRGDRLPQDMVGDYFYGEVVARIVRRLRPVKDGGFTQLGNVYPLSEFIRSVDPLFRPVDMTTAPDGTMYITDMYHGIIQESQWSGPGTYLRARIEQYQLDKVVGKGRIWRLSYDGIPRDTTQPRMLDETPAELVSHLNHPNGWWRDMAQQLIVLSGDRTVVPALTGIARTSPPPSSPDGDRLARLHALWSLEGLGALEADLVRELMQDADPHVRQAAIRVSETLYKAGDRSFATDYLALTRDADADVSIQALLTANLLKVDGLTDAVQAAYDASQAKGVRLVAGLILNPEPEEDGRRGGGGRGGGPTRSPAETAILERGAGIYNELCYACHGQSGRGEPSPANPGRTMAPALAGSPRVVGHRDYVIKALLHGLTGPVDGVRYSEVMIPMGMNDDEWIAAVASYVRNSFSNSASFVTPEQVARVRAASTGRTTSWTTEEVLAALPRQVVVTPEWAFAASHNAPVAAYAVSIQPWTSGAVQQPGMWFQIALPEAARLTEIQFESPPVDPDAEPVVAGAPPRDGGRGGSSTATADGHPVAYEVRVSTDGTTWSEPVAAGRGAGSQIAITFEPVEARYVRITQTGTSPEPRQWSIRRLRLFEAEEF